MKKTLLVAAFIAAGSPVFAAPWKVENDKGLLVHRLDAKPLKLMMVCDPDGAYIPPQVFMMIDVQAKRVESGNLSVTRDGETVALPIENGGISAKDNPDIWNKAVGWLLDGGAVDLSAGGKAVSIAASAPMQNPCLIK